MYYFELCEALGLDLSPAQAEMAWVAFDGQKPTGSEVSLKLWGSTETLERASVFAAVCGRFSGKSRLGALRLVHLAVTVDLSSLAPGEIASCPIVAPDIETATHTMRFALSAAQLLMPESILWVNARGFAIKREHGRVVTIKVYAASAGGRSIRGRSLPGALLEEMAFFRDSNYRVNDQEILRAITPRVMPGGQIICLSSPWAKNGLLYELWRDNYGHPQHALVAHAPTLLMRQGDPNVEHMVAQETARDPQNAAREFGAQFLETDASNYFDARAVEQAQSEELHERPAEAIVAVGADFGFSHDSSALVALWRDRDRYVVSDIQELVPSGAPLKPSEVVAHFARILKSTPGASHVVSDLHYRESIREELERHGLFLVSGPEGASGKAESYAITRALLHGGQLVLPKHDKLARQLIEVQVRPTAGGAISIQSPRKASGHGDIVSALVQAVWKASTYGFKPIVVEPEPGSPENYSRQIELRKRNMRRQRDEDYWKEVGT